MLPKNLHYQNKVESASARAYTAAIQPQNGTGNYSAGNTITINIPTTPNTVLVPSECYLKFDLSGITNGGTASAFVRLDKAGAHGVIQRLRVMHGSQELENLDAYGVLVGQMMALQQSGDSLGGKLNVLAGLNSSALYNATTREVTAGIVGERLTAFGANDAAAYAIGAVAPSRTYAITLMSMVGSLSPQYIPLFEMTSSPLSVSIQLVSSCLKFATSAQALANGNFTISNCEFIGSFIELSDDSISVIRQSLMGSPLQYVIQSYANYTTNSSLSHNSASSISHAIPFKFASLRSLFAMIRANADGATTFFPLSSNHFNLVDWRLRLGSQLVPYKPASTMVEHYAELIKAIGSLSDMNHEPSINWYSYSSNAIPVADSETAQTVVQTAKSDCFALGFDLETYASADKDKIFAGMNTLNFDIFWGMNFNANGSGAAVNARFDYFGLYDNVLVFENGICYSRK